MIRKPNADWQRRDEGAAVRTVRTAAVVATGSVRVARRGGYAVRGLVCYFFAALWGFAALASGIDGGLPSIIGVGAMAALAAWAGRRAFAKARESSDSRAP
jgi:lipopolysaccharide export LptBFGC system permease protein LptF